MHIFAFENTYISLFVYGLNFKALESPFSLKENEKQSHNTVFPIAIDVISLTLNAVFVELVSGSYSVNGFGFLYNNYSAWWEY